MTDLPPYSDHDDAGDIFGQEALREPRRNGALHAHLGAGGSILTFPRTPRGTEDLNAMFDRILGTPGALK